MSIDRLDTEYEPDRGELVVHPLTGEAIDLAQAPDEHVADFLSQIRDHEDALKDAKRIITQELLRRMDYQAKYTLRAGGYTLKSQSPAPAEEFDELQLREDLLALQDEGVISPEAVDNAVETVVTYKVRKAGINALRKLGGRVRDTVDRHAHEVEKRRYVTVERVR